MVASSWMGPSAAVAMLERASRALDDSVDGRGRIAPRVRVGEGMARETGREHALDDGRKAIVLVPRMQLVA